MVLISTVSTFFLSFLSSWSSFSCLDLVHERPGSFSPPPSFTLRRAATTQRVMQGSKQTVSPRSGRIERRAARGKGREWAPGIAQDAAGERDDGATLAPPPLPLVLRAIRKHNVWGWPPNSYQDTQRPDRTARCACCGRGAPHIV